MNQISLIRGCSLFPLRAPGEYALGSYSRLLTVTSAYQRTALTQLAIGMDPLAGASQSLQTHLKSFLNLLIERGLLQRDGGELSLPRRSLNHISESDIAINQLRARSAPELAQSEWIDGKGDGGKSTLAARARFLIELSGRSRVITLLYSILLASGVSQVRFADRYFRAIVSDLDIGFGAIAPADLGGNYYEILASRRRQISLLPIEPHAIDSQGGCGGSYQEPSAVIHYGECDPEVIIEWSQKRIPHLLIHPPVGDEILLGPLVLPGESPCSRCLSLYEIDNFGFRQDQKIPLTALDELPAATAHFVAAIIASHILHFIDQQNSYNPDEISRNTGVGEITYINFQRLTEPQVVAIARHPLCGCDR